MAEDEKKGTEESIDPTNVAQPTIIITELFRSFRNKLRDAHETL